MERTQKMSSENIYLPQKGTIVSVNEETDSVRLFRIRMNRPIQYRPGQFFMVSLWGAGEVPISVTSLSGEEGFIEFCIRRAGSVTSRLFELKSGETLWFRGPYGRPFPLDIARGKDVVIVAGGIGIAPLRPLIEHFSKRKKARVVLLYGSRSPEEIIYRKRISEWQKMGVKVVLTVDRGSRNWKGNIGVVTTLWHLAEVEFKKSVAYICGPEVMIKAAMQDLFFFGMPEDRIITTLEAHMKCGVGKCGHCYAGPLYICKEGPVFTYKEIKELSIIS